MCGMDMETAGVYNDNWQPPWMGSSQSITATTSPRLPLPCLFMYLKVRIMYLANLLVLDIYYLIDLRFDKKSTCISQMIKHGGILYL